MPSPFPGMDPFLENDEWEDFHTTFNTVIRELLSPKLEPRYVIRIERRVYVESAAANSPQPRRADVAILPSNPDEPHRAGGSAAQLTIAPVECLLPMPEEKRETYVVIRERETREIVTVLETLSPGNKRLGSEGRRRYLSKREELLQSQVHLMEMDLLWGGERLPMSSPLPQGDYYAIVSRRHLRPRAEVYAWRLSDPLPTIPVPLKKGDPDVLLDLQTVVATVYDRARYDLSVDYAQPLSPPLDESETAWLHRLLNTGGASRDV